jgi:hypothetical protein
MFPHHSRKVLFAGLLAVALSGPVSANDGVTTTQQTAVGQVATEVASAQASPTVAQETFATETNGRIGASRLRPKVSDSRPYALAVRQPSFYRPALILGIGY